MRKKYHIVGTTPKSNRKRGKIDTLNTHDTLATHDTLNTHE